MQSIITTNSEKIRLQYGITMFKRYTFQGLSPETKRWYNCRLSLIASAIGETRFLCSITELQLITLRENWESSPKISTDTLHGYIRALRKLFIWLYQKNFIETNLVENIPLPKLPKRGRKGISDHHAELILAEAKQWSVRDYAMLLVFQSTSARRGGVSDIKLSDLNLDQPEPDCRKIQVVEKGQKERTVMMDKETYNALIEWLKIRPQGSEYVFVSDKGEKLKPNSISEVIRRYKERLGIKGPCSPHQWRHRWFRRILSNGMPLGQAAQLGGHETTTVTHQFYGQYAIKELIESYDKYFTS